MRTIYLGLFFLFFTSSKIEKHTTSSYTIVYFLNTTSSFGLPLSNNDFWSYSDEFDILVIKGSKITGSIDNSIANFQNSTQTPIHTLIALVRIRNGLPKDTLYTEPMFKYWNNGKNYFVDSTRNLYPLLSSFLYSWHK